MKVNTETPFTEDPPVFLLKNLTARALNENEYSRASELLEQEHCLGGHPQGRQLLQVVEYQGNWAKSAWPTWHPVRWVWH